VNGNKWRLWQTGGERMSKNWVAKKEAEYKRQLGKAYDAGALDGYMQGIEDTHIIWTRIAKRTKGVGPKLQKALIDEAQKAMAEWEAERFGPPSMEAEAVREYLQQESGADDNERDIVTTG
jgi:hypothetical protein